MATIGNFGQEGVFSIESRDFLRALNQYVGSMGTAQAKKAIMRRAAAVVAYNVRNLANPKSEMSDPKKGEKYHYFYSGAGYRRRKIKIFKGNLLKSTKYYFNKYNDFEIGPKVIRTRLPDEVGRTAKTTSGFYAAMIFGSAEKFRQMVIEPELIKPEVFIALQESFRKHHERQARANGLQP